MEIKVVIEEWKTVFLFWEEIIIEIIGKKTEFKS